MSRLLRAAAFACGLAGMAGDASAQGYRLAFDSRVQQAAYRGVTADSIRAADAVIGSTGGFETPDGFAVRCTPGSGYCFFFRPGPVLRGGPLVASADLTLWGVGIRGLSLRLNGRLGADLGEGNVWPGTDPALQLIEAYAEYAHRIFRARGGRQILVNRLGIEGFDGVSASARESRLGFEAEGYVGLGLARAAALPVTSPVLNPLDDFRPQSRQVIAGAGLGWSGRLAEARLDYQREVDRDMNKFVSERVALSLDFRPGARWSFTGAVDYDLANTWFGNADATIRYLTPWITVAGGLRQYRPHFDLWTIWGAFSPVPYHAVNAAVWVRPVRTIELRGRWERYSFSDTETETPLVDVEADGWRVGFGLTYRPTASWTLDAGYHDEFGPGAASDGFEASVMFLPRSNLTLTAYGSTLDRPLEFRFQDASVEVLGLDAEWSVSDRLRLALGGARYWETRDRPDAAALDWDQTRLHARVTLVFRSETDAVPLPPALRTRPRAASR